MVGYMHTKINTRFLFILFLMFSSVSFGQNLDFVKIISSNSINEGGRIIKNESYTLFNSWFFGTVDFDPNAGVYNLSTTSNSNAIVKLDNASNFVWAKQLQLNPLTPSSDMQIKTDYQHNVFAYGTFRGTADFDPGGGVYNLTADTLQKDYFIVKLDSNGNFIWAIQIPNNKYVNTPTLSVDKYNNIYFTGTFKDTVDFDPGVGVNNLISRKDKDAFILKLDSAGNFIWVNRIDANKYVKITGADIDSNQNIVLSAMFDDSVNCNPGFNNYIISPNYRASLVIKFDRFGNYIFAKKFGESTFAVSWNCKIDKQNSIYVTGGFDTIADFDPGIGIHLVTPGFSDAYLLKLDSAGNFQWVFNLYNIFASSRFREIEIDTGNNAVLLGVTTGGVIDFDPSNQIYSYNFFPLVGGSITHSFIVSYSSLGNFKYMLPISGNVNALNYPQSIALDKYNEIYVTGYKNGYADMDPSSCVVIPDSGYVDNTFILGLKICNTNVEPENESFCDSIILNNFTYYNDSTFILQFPTANCCDSIVKFTLTKKAKSFYNYSVTSCNNYWYENTNYSTSGTYTYTLINAAGCDSVVTLQLTITPIDTSISQNGNILSANGNGLSYQWYNCTTNQIISGATGQSYTATANGNYAAIVSNGTCADTSACRQVKNLAIANYTTTQIKIAPNPATNFIKIDIDNFNLNQQYSCTIINVLGECVYASIIKNANNSIDVSHFAKGIYYVKVNEAMVKLIVE